MKNQKRIKIGYKIYTLENGLLVESERVQGHKPFDTQEEVARLQQSLCKREEFLTALENHGRKQGWME